MIKPKKKLCHGLYCKGEIEQYIWKRVGGLAYCQRCASALPSSAKPKAKPLPIPKQSEKRKKLDAAYKVLRKQYLKDNSFCVAKLPGCTHWATTIHHRKGRIGDLYLDTSEWAAVCMTCHVRIEKNPELAKERGLSKSRLSKS